MSTKRFRRGLRLIGQIPRCVSGYLTGHWRRLLLSLAVVVILLGGGGLLVVWTGLISISASSGHWAVTSVLLHTAMRNAVETQSLGIEAPDLDDPALVLKGAGHYATGCMPCHGAPGEERSPIVRQITPTPPYLPPKIKEWTSEQLFWIVKHGVKFTAMPAWVSLERDDEVWAMVAFLQQLPTLSPEQFQQLAYGPLADEDSATTDESAADAAPGYQVPDDDPLRSTLANCARCHGAKGNGRGLGAFPKLAGQSAAYLRASLQAYASGERNSGIMQPIAADLSDAAIEAIARYYSGLERASVQEAPVNSTQVSKRAGDAAAIEDGRSIALEGIPAQGVPSCIDCHGPRNTPRNPFYPELAGQYAGYLALQLTLFKSGQRGGTPYADVMHTAAKGLTEEQIQDLALYYESLGGASDR